LTQRLSLNSSITLDLFRAISSQLVVIGHGISFCGIFVGLHQPNFPWMQNIAVVIFFILSGFLISYSLGRKKGNSNYRLPHYFIDRFSRIYVAFIPALFFILITDTLNLKLNGDLFRYSEAFNIKTFISNIFMLQDYPILHFSTSFGSARPLWTLAIEWWIYILVGFIFFSLKKDSIKTSTILIIMILSIVPLYNLFGGRGHGLTFYWIYGLLAYYIWNSNILKKLSFGQVLASLFTLIIIASVRVMSTMTEYEPYFALFLTGVILFSIEASSRVSFHRSIESYSTILSSYSYTLYLIHYSIYDLLVTYYGKGYKTFIFGFVLSNLFAYILGYFFEQKATKKVKSTMYNFWGKLSPRDNN